jgi:tripartite-type tricarboxylate transporter receptor subunit TctC
MTPPATAKLRTEYIAGIEMTGLGVPNNTPAEIIEAINNATNSALADPNVKTQLATLGNTVLPGSPADSVG